MAKTNETADNSNSSLGMGDINVIRNILFGQQSAEFQRSFDILQTRMGNTDTENDARFKSLESLLTKRLDAVENTLLDRIQKLENSLAEAKSQLSQKIESTSQSDKAALGNMLIEIGKKLSE